MGHSHQGVEEHRGADRQTEPERTHHVRKHTHTHGIVPAPKGSSCARRWVARRYTRANARSLARSYKARRQAASQVGTRPARVSCLAQSPPIRS